MLGSDLTFTSDSAAAPSCRLTTISEGEEDDNQGRGVRNVG
jgi:hypothetical protein